MKHIEQILPEYAADDITALLLSDATASAALSRLLHDWTGCAIPPLATTPESEVEELVPLCLSILRRHWTTPLTALGDGTTPMSLADLLRRLIGDRVQGNEALGIPPANDNIPTAVAALLDRKIGGVPEAVDGISLVNLICSSYGDVTELTDTTYDWNYNVTGKVNLLKSMFPSLTKLTMNCKKATVAVFTTQPNIGEINYPYLEEAKKFAQTFEAGKEYYYAPHLKKLDDLAVISNEGSGNMLVNCKRIYFPELESIGEGISYPNGIYQADISNLESIEFPSCRYFKTWGDSRGEYTTTKWWKYVLGKLEYMAIWTQNNIIPLISPSDLGLIHVEIGAGTAMSFSLERWNPTNALDASLDTLVTDEDCHNNLEQFLSNFRTYIAQRLTDKGSGLTLTLSQAVRDAIQTDPEIVSIITSKGWTISPAPSV